MLCTTCKFGDTCLVNNKSDEYIVTYFFDLNLIKFLPELSYQRQLKKHGQLNRCYNYSKKVARTHTRK